MATRRSLAGGAVAALLGTATAASTTPLLACPDASLLNATAQAKRLGDYTIATQRGVLTVAAQEAITQKLRPVYDELDAHLDAVIATPARTLEGLRAKAATAADWFRENLSDDPDDDVDQRIIASLLRDLTGGHRDGLSSPPLLPGLGWQRNASRPGHFPVRVQPADAGPAADTDHSHRAGAGRLRAVADVAPR